MVPWRPIYNYIYQILLKAVYWCLLGSKHDLMLVLILTRFKPRLHHQASARSQDTSVSPKALEPKVPGLETAEVR